jgi:hypothetical protein
MSRKRERGFEAEESSQDSAGRAAYSSPKRLRGASYGPDGQVKVRWAAGRQGKETDMTRWGLCLDDRPQLACTTPGMLPPALAGC